MAKSNQAKNAAKASDLNDPISELSEIMKLDSGDQKAEQQPDSGPEVNLESELLSNFENVEPEITDSEEDIDLAIEEAFGDSLGEEFAALEDEVAAAQNENEGDFSLTQSARSRAESILKEAERLSALQPGKASVPPELENQLKELLAGLNRVTESKVVPDEEPLEFGEPDQTEYQTTSETEADRELVARLNEGDDDREQLDEADDASLVELMKTPMDEARSDPSTPRSEEAIPDIDITEITEPARPVEDDIEIPDAVFETEVQAAPNFDELDEEFANAFNKLSEYDKVTDEENHGEYKGVAPHLGETLDNIFAGMSDGPAAGLRVAPHDIKQESEDYQGFDREDQNDEGALQEWNTGGSGVNYARDTDDESGPPQIRYEQDRLQVTEAPPAPENGGRRGVMIASIVVLIAVAGGIGAFALSFGGGDEAAAPVLIKADDGPIKVKPKDPGGRTVPNEDKAVYERVAGTGETTLPSQEKLISTAEEPLNISTGEEEAVETALTEPEETTELVLPDPAKSEPAAIVAAGVPKGEDRVLPEEEAPAISAADEIVAVTPRRVKTLIVKPDGTLVPREDETPPSIVEEVLGAPANPTKEAARDYVVAEPANLSSQGAPDKMTALVSPAVDEAVPVEKETGEDSAGTPVPTPAPRSVETVDESSSRVTETAAAARSDEPRSENAGSNPAAPIENVKNAEAKPEPEVAAVTPQPESPTVAPEWWVQISSQPTREAAQTSYANMASRYGSIIGDRGVNIYRAEIEGKGTFYRVRIAGGDRTEATTLCTRLKNAGANCFVAR